MITYEYKYTEIELDYADLDNGEFKRIVIEIKGHRKQRNRKFILEQLRRNGIETKEYRILNVALKLRQYQMTEDQFIQLAQPSLF